MIVVDPIDKVKMLSNRHKSYEILQAGLQCDGKNYVLIYWFIINWIISDKIDNVFLFQIYIHQIPLK